MTPHPYSPDSSPDPPKLPAPVPAGHTRYQLTKSARRVASPPATDLNLTPAFFWRVFCQWWKWVVPLGIFSSVAAGALVWYLHVPMYEATALVKIEAEVPYIAFEKGNFSRDADRYIQTQIEILRSSVVLDKVLARNEIASIEEINQQVAPVTFMQEHLTIEQVGKSELYQVSYVSRSPQHAKMIADTVVAEYIAAQDDFDYKRSQIVIAKLDEVARLREENLKQLRNEVVALAKEVTGKDPFGHGAVMDVTAFSPAASIYSSLTGADVDLAVLNAELEALNDAPILVGDKAVASGLVDLEISNRSDVRQLEQRIADLNEVMAQIKGKPRMKIGDTWEKDPDYLRIQKQVAEAKAELDKLKEAAQNQWIELRAQERKAEQQRLISETTREIDALSKKREMLAEKFDKHLEELKSSGAQSAELELKKAELEREQKVFELIAARRLALQTERDAPARVSRIENAKEPSTAIEPVPYKLLLLACSLSLVVPLAFAVAQESIARRISSPEQLTAESLLPMLGEVARFPMRHVTAKQYALPAVQKRELFIFAESIDSLRTNLMLTENLGVPGQKRIIAICSAASGEGKTSVATSLAMSIAEATKQPTLVLDADLRAPDIADFLEVPDHPGVAEVLSGKASLGQAIHRVGETQGYVMPAGKLQANPHHILQGAKIDNLLDALREKFSTIVIDTPPVLSASESLVYARAADLVVFCSLADVSRAKQVRLAVDRLQSTGANIAGAVLSGVQVSRYVYNYGSYGRNA